jgi:hypothetical protein
MTVFTFGRWVTIKRIAADTTGPRMADRWPWRYPGTGVDEAGSVVAVDVYDDPHGYEVREQAVV